MLPANDNESAESRSQWYMYQTKVFSKLCTQLHRARQEQNLKKFVDIIRLFNYYGEVMVKDFEFEADRHEHLKKIFELMRDLK